MSLINYQEMDLVESFLRYFFKGQKVKFSPFCTPFSQKRFSNFFSFFIMELPDESISDLSKDGFD
jgi:hypothetical protein